MKKTTQTSIIRSTFTALFAALICAGCFISIPMPGGVPITVQNMFAILASTILGGIQGAGAVGIFLVLGGLGIPVFSGMTGGINILAGPTGGFLWGYFLGAIVAGLIAGTPHVYEKNFNIKNWIRISIASFVGFALIYAPGIPWFLHTVLSTSSNPLNAALAGLSAKEQFGKVLAWTLIPFIPGDIIKIIISIPLSCILRPIAARYLYASDMEEEEAIIERLKKRNKPNAN